MFSAHEEQVLKIIGRKKITVAEITESFKSEQPHLDTQNYVASVIRRINRKCVHHKLDWTLVGKGTGRGGRTVWRETR
jgi:hypothetical protein